MDARQCKHRILAQGVIAMTLLLTADAASAANVCTYNDATTSFGASYTSNQESSFASATCSSPNMTAAQFIGGQSFGVTATTAPATGDYKFLLRNENTTKVAPVLSVGVSDDPEVTNFPDGALAAPAGGGCGLPGVGIPRLEGHLHRNWPLYGKTYYYGEPNADPPNDPATVTTSSSPYLTWAPFSPTSFYRYKDNTAHGWGASSSHPQAGADAAGLCSGASTKSGVDIGYTTAATACAVTGLTAAEQAACAVCLAGTGAGTGYYLHDGTTAGDLKYSVFRGDLLNDYPPAWVSLSWAGSFFINYDVGKAQTGKALFQLRRNLNQVTVSASGSSCPTPSMQQIGTPGVPACSAVNPWNQAAVDAAQKTYCDDQSNFNGGNSIWGKPVVAGKQWHTPAGDLLKLGKDAKSAACAGLGACQITGALYIGFGIPCGEGVPTNPFSSAALPNQGLSSCTGECVYVNPDSTCSTGCSNQNHLAEAAHYLYNSQGVLSYFIGMGPHTAAMRRAAAEGHGKYFDAQDVEGLHDGLIGVINDIIGLGTSSATSTVNTVQINVGGQEELVPRFVALQAAPGGGNTGSSNATWDGHLFKYFLFSEFAGNCTKAGDAVPIPNPNAPVCNASCVCPGGSCTGRWIVDANCHLIAPENSGFFFEASYNGGTGQLTPSTAAATPVWDAAKTIRSVNWYQRKIYTAVDTNHDGVVNSSDGDTGVGALSGMTLLTNGAVAGNSDLSGGVSDAVAQALVPYLAIQGTTACGDIESAIGVSLPTSTLGRDVACARVILNFVLGEDLLDSNQNGSRTVNRISMLGDVFHSSPQDIGPPAPEALCQFNNRRCTSTLFNGDGKKGLPDYQPLETPTNIVDPTTGNAVTNAGGVDAYQAYYQDQSFGLKHPRVTLFGSNDGVVHAIQTGCYVKSVNLTSAIFSGSVPTAVYWEGAGAASCVTGSLSNGTELWGFIPPDMLPKLKNLLLGTHQYFVDGTPMVRDIYAGTSATKQYNAATKDFKRVAIFGERSGGTRWFALDVTDPTKPGFRWMFPQPNTIEEVKTGFTFAEWLPGAPPVVPIRYTTGASGYPRYTDSSGSAQSFAERWVAILPGGYDPYGIRGKSLFFVDAYTGAKINEFSGAPGQDFSFAALPAAVAWGTSLNPTTPTYNKGFFDTAVVGDLGGQVWTLRFNDVAPARWYMARGFRSYKSDDTGTKPYKMQHRSPIFEMASVARMPEGYMRAFFSTGDRDNMAEAGLGACSLYNQRACGLQNCVVTTALNASLAGGATESGLSSYDGTANATYTTTSNFSYASSPACSPNSMVLNSCVTCSGTGAGKGTTAVAPAQPQFSCAYTGTTPKWQCGDIEIAANDPASRLEEATVAVPASIYADRGYYNRFVAFNVFGAGSRSPFTTAATTSAYDTASLTETDLVDLFASASSHTFNPVSPPILSAAAGVNGASNGFLFGYPLIDERTATNSALLQNCVAWYTMEPGAPCNVNGDCPSGATCTAASHTCTQAPICGSSTAIPARTAFLYQVNATDGSSNCGLTASTYLRTMAPTNSFVVPPPPAQPLISVNSAGQIQYSIVAPAGQLSPAAASSTAGASSSYSFLYSIETPREVHQCRHANDPKACQ